MHIGQQSVDSSSQPAVPKTNNSISTNTVKSVEVNKKVDSPIVKTDLVKSEKNSEKLQEAVTSINEFLEVQNKSSKFVFHEGLDQYYVKLVDAETDEVIKEIPPERLLNAFYEMKKLAGMIVDEKI